MPSTSHSLETSQYVGQQIRLARLTMKLTQAAVADRLGVSAPYIASVESGRANMTISQLANIANALRVGMEVNFPILVDEA